MRLMILLNALVQLNSFKVARHFGSGQFFSCSSKKVFVVPSSPRIFTANEILRLKNRVDELNSCSSPYLSFVPFIISGAIYGYVSKLFLCKLQKFEKVFALDYRNRNGEQELRFINSLDAASADEKTAALLDVCRTLRAESVITGWRDELLPVTIDFSSSPVMLVERAAYPWFGFKGYGVHIHGFVRGGEKGEVSKLWVAKRSKTKSTWPNMLDHIVAGGQPYGISLRENLIKECAEEANIPRDLAMGARPAGAVSYASLDSHGNVKRDVLFCFDLELPETFVPTPVDGEVDSFELKEINWVMDKIMEGGSLGYKPNCNLANIDFLIRHGFISSDSPGYLHLLRALRSGDCS